MLAYMDNTAKYYASYHYDDMETVRIMKQIVPEYKSKNSVYESLD